MEAVNSLETFTGFHYTTHQPTTYQKTVFSVLENEIFEFLTEVLLRIRSFEM